MSSAKSGTESISFATFQRNFDRNPDDLEIDDENDSDGDLHRAVPRGDYGNFRGSPQSESPDPVERSVNEASASLDRRSRSRSLPPSRSRSADGSNSERFEVEFSGYQKRVSYKSSPNLLHELAERLREAEQNETDDAIPRSNLGMSTYFLAILRECEMIVYDIVTGVGRGPKGQTTLDDVRMILACLDDFALRTRPKIATDVDIDDEYLGERTLDLQHQRALFICRLKLLYTLACSLPNDLNATRICYGAYRPSLHIDYYWFEAAYKLEEAQLVAWIYKHKAFHPSLISIDPPRLLIRFCTIGSLWRSLLAFIAAWPHLPMCAATVRCFDELRLRVAFFLAYRETVNEEEEDFSDSDDSDSEDGHGVPLTFEQKQKKRADERILGLRVNAFTLTSFGGSAKKVPIDAPLDGSASLLDDPDFWGTTRDSKGTLYKHVKMQFVDQTERILHALQMLLRSFAGFRHSPVSAAERSECYLCNKYRQSSTNLARVHTVVTQTLDINNTDAGMARVVVEEKFRSELHALYIEPSELETFIEYHPQEVGDELNAISKKRNATFLVLGKRFIQPDAYKLWTEDGLGVDLQEPAHALLLALTIDHLLNATNGLRFSNYMLDMKLVQPFPYRPVLKTEGKLRPLIGTLNDLLNTTGTFRYRFKFSFSHGATAPLRHIEYPHPVIVKMANSYNVCHSGHMHHFETIDEAVCAWSLALCLDPHIRGFTGEDTGRSLHQFTSSLNPDQAGQLQDALREAEMMIESWNPATQLVDQDEIDGGSQSSNRHPMYKNATQF